MGLHNMPVGTHKDFPDGTCFVYVVAHKTPAGLVGPVKVGVASNPAYRLSSLQTGNPHALALFAIFATPTRQIAMALEDGFHQTQAGKRLVGEWFEMDPEAAMVLMWINLGVALNVHTEFSNDEIDETLDIACRRYAA